MYRVVSKLNFCFNALYHTPKYCNAPIQWWIVSSLWMMAMYAEVTQYSFAKGHSFSCSFLKLAHLSTVSICSSHWHKHSSLRSQCWNSQCQSFLKLELFMFKFHTAHHTNAQSVPATYIFGQSCQRSIEMGQDSKDALHTGTCWDGRLRQLMASIHSVAQTCTDGLLLGLALAVVSAPFISWNLSNNGQLNHSETLVGKLSY